ncbi:MAG: hypothetical protein CW338_07655 [Clostridiales bacterium]|nr:hypothetical protein [Clostridiales bacterium]
MTYVPARATGAQQRLTVLYALDQMGPCYDMQLLQFLCDEELMNYFDMMFALVDLCREGQAVRTHLVSSNLYEVTPAGRETLSLCASHLPESVKQQIDRKAPEMRARFRREQECAADYEKTERGDYRLDMYVMEHAMEMVKITLSLPDEGTAMELKQRWNRVGSDVYAYMMSRLAEDEP